MSHITDVKLKIRDLDALEEAADELGFTLRRGQTTHAWYGQFVGDSEDARQVVRERGVESLGKCAHALRLKDHRAGVDYEIGVVASKDGDGYDLLYDSWGPGQRLEQAAGASLQAVRQEYSVAKATQEAKKRLKGFAVTRQRLANGSVRLRLRKR